ncbi:MAG TPA: hypothetical protein VK832_04130 [Burkholderiaceae bacterium]|jgi:hypothetical protein|nr:hypothetical protein [Burkholderiaceae bacterium]
MKTALVFVLFALCGIASAQTPDAPQASPVTTRQQHFEQAKSNRLAKIAAHLDALQKTQSCVQAATNFATLHACRPARPLGK